MYEYEIQDALDDTKKALAEAKSMVTFSCHAHRKNTSDDIAARWITLEGCFKIIRAPFDKLGLLESPKLENNLKIDIEDADRVNVDFDMDDGLLDALIQSIECYEYTINRYLELQLEEAA